MVEIQLAEDSVLKSLAARQLFLETLSFVKEVQNFFLAGMLESAEIILCLQPPMGRYHLVRI